MLSLAPPCLGSSPLGLESTLQELSLHHFPIEMSSLGQEVAHAFEENPLLPGVILMQAKEFVGMISRRRFLECMSRPYGLELFLKRPLQDLYRFAAIDLLICPADMPIVAATRQALQRPPELLYEPIVVETADRIYQLLDIQRLLVAHSQIHELATRLLDENSQAQMIQTEKMASLGRMVAGVAHEILNPINFISGNLHYLSNYTQDLFNLLAVYEAELPQTSNQVAIAKEDIEYEFLAQDLPRIIESIKLGADRLKQIASSLRNFSHMDEANRRPADLHECLDNTLLILSSRLKQEIEVIRAYGDLPEVNCYSGPLSQVFMNLISNAVDALVDFASLPTKPMTSDWKPQITITTEMHLLPLQGYETLCPWVGIRIRDNGPGIPAEVQKRIFDPFFTTKPVGKGTGLGLAISQQIIQEKHQGQLKLVSQVGQGTEFEILIPCL